MNLAKLSKNGQVTIPIEIRKKLDLREGDKIIFFEKDGEIYITNTTRNERALREAQKAFEGLKEALGVETEEDVDRMIAEMRKNKRESS